MVAIEVSRQGVTLEIVDLDCAISHAHNNQDLDSQVIIIMLRSILI